MIWKKWQWKAQNDVVKKFFGNHWGVGMRFECNKCLVHNLSQGVASTMYLLICGKNQNLQNIAWFCRLVSCK